MTPRTNQHAATGSTYPASKANGVLSCLRFEITRRQYRCNACNKWQQTGSGKVWVPVRITVGDPAWAVAEEAKHAGASGNGEFVAWCVVCAKKLNPKPTFALPIQQRKVAAEFRQRLDITREEMSDDELFRRFGQSMIWGGIELAVRLREFRDACRHELRRVARLFGFRR